MKIMMIFGTRPEAIKMSMVAKRLFKENSLQLKICVTGQHREMLDQVMEIFQIKADYDLNIMKHGQDLTDVTASILVKLKDVIRDEKPDWIMVHGDTTTALCGALAGYYSKIKVAHIEAGLRTGNIYEPWPEEINRQLISKIAEINFAPTLKSKQNLLEEGVDENKIIVTGNTVIDALLYARNLINKEEMKFAIGSINKYIEVDKRIILVTGHRRENFGKGFVSICNAIKRIASRNDVQIIYPVHLNPNVQGPVNDILGGQNNIKLIDPQEYLPFVYLMEKSYLILTDSGGIQEEAPSLGKPILVMRNNTERPEAVDAGTVKIVGTNEDAIVEEVNKLLDDNESYQKMANAINPYGDGLASERICTALVSI